MVPKSQTEQRQDNGNQFQKLLIQTMKEQKLLMAEKHLSYCKGHI